jgi:hypothetical protein
MMKLRCITAAVLVSLASQQVIAQVNLLNNPGFETQGSDSLKAYHWEAGNPDNHGAWWGTATREPWRWVRGSWEGAIRGLWANAGDNGGFWQEVPATPGKRYRFSAFLFADGEGNKWTADAQEMKIEFFNSSMNMVGVASLPLDDVGPNWVRKSFEAVAPANSAWVRVVVSAWGVSQNGALQLDELELIEVDETPVPSNPGPSSRRTGLVISEIMYHPADRDDGKDLEYVELFNTTPFTNQLAGYRLAGSIEYTFPGASTIGPFSYLVVAREPSSVQTVYGISGVLGPFEGSLPNSSGRVRLRRSQAQNPQEDAILLEVNYSDQPPWPLAADGAGHSLVLSRASYGEDDPRAWSASVSLGGAPGGPDALTASVYTNVVINEFLAHTDEPAWDYIELYNTATQAINIGGCTLSDAVGTNKFAIPAGTIIPARGHKVFLSVTNPPSSSPTNLTFNLSSKGEVIVFRAPDGTVVDAIRFAAQQNDVSVGRYPDGAADFHELLTTTPGTTNTTLSIRNVVINEIMYNPISGDDNDQYVELHNRGASPVPVENWRFVEGITFTFPSGATIPGNGYLVVAKNALHLMSNHPGVLNSGNTIGNFDGNLAKSGERIVLSKPDDPTLPNQDFVIVDEVTYHDGGRWGEWSDGGGSSLELIDPFSDNRQAANWADSDESAKSSWTLIEHTGVLDNGSNKPPSSIDQVQILNLRRGEVLVDNVEAFRVGFGNRVSNGTFESGLGGWTVQGNHIRSALSNEGYSSSRSLHVVATGGGDIGANQVRSGLTSAFSAGNTVTLKARMRWLRGSPYVVMRLRGNWLEATGPLSVPKNLGTPAQQNSRKVTNAGPDIWDVAHYPLVPASNEAVTVTARVRDPDGINYVQLRYRIDPSSSIVTVNMTHVYGGVYSGVIPAQTRGTRVVFHVQARDSHASPVTSVFPDKYPEQECIVRFGDGDAFSNLGTYRFWLTQANIDEWSNRVKQSDEYLDATFIYGKERVIYNAGIRWRGSPFIRPTFREPEFYERRGAYRVKFPADEPFLCDDELNMDTLESDDRDPTSMRERIGFQIAADMGLPMSYQRYILVFLNGIQHPYAYADTHHVERDYFRTWFPGADEGEAYKVDDWIELNSFDPDDFVVTDADLGMHVTTGGEKKKARYRWNWEKRANAGFDDDYTGLMRLVDAANLANDQYTATLEAVADMRQWMRMFAFRHAIADWDGYGYYRGKNTFMYRPPQGRWNMVPWDLDFGLGVEVDNFTWPDASVFDISDNTPVVARMISHPPFRRYYWQALRDAATVAMLSTKLNPMIDETHEALIANGVASRSPDVALKTWLGIPSLKSWISQRRTYLLGQLNPMTNFNLTAACVNTNGNVVTLTGRAPIQIYTLTFNGIPYDVTWSTVTNWTMTIAIPSGPSTIVVAGFDENGSQEGSSVSLNVNYSGSDVNPQDNVIINEIMYNPADELAEFLELHNRSATHAFDLTGYRMAGLDFTFQQGATIPPGGYLLLVENTPAFAAVHTNLTAVAGEYAGKLDNAGERLQLMRPVGEEEEVVDTVVYDRLAPWPAAADGHGPSLQLIDGQRDRNRVSNWGVDPVNLYTPGASNSIARSLPEFPRVWINELQSTNVTGVVDNNGEREPWLELYNEETALRTLTNFFLSDDFDNLKKWQFPADAFAPAEWFRLVWMDGQTGQTAGTNYHASFRLSSATSGVVALVYSNAGEVVIVDYLNYPAIPAGKSFGSYPDGDTFYRMLLKVPTPGGTNHPLTDAAMVELLVPRVMQGDQTGGENLNRLPYAFRVQINNLRPSSEYRASNRVVIPEDPFDQDGAGNAVYVKTDGSDFIRTTDSPRFREGDVDRRHVRFITDASGSFTGWFVTEPSGNARFTPGNTVYLRMLLNDGMNGTNIEHYLTTTSAVSVVALGTASTNATGLVGYSHAGPKQFVALYDNAVGEGRPVSATYVEATGAAVDDKYATFYVSDVSGQANLWGTLIPNNFPSGVRRVESRSLLDGAIVHATEIEDGWIGTIDPSGGLTPIALNAPPLIDPIQNVEIGPGSLLVLQTAAFDPDAPPQILTFSLAAAPSGAGIGSQTGEFQWRPGFDRVNTTNYITVRVMDDGEPQSLSDTRTFAVRVGGEEDVLEVNGQSVQAGQDFVITWPSDIGTTYRVQYLHSLTSFPWLVLGDDVVATEPVSSKTDSGAGSQTQRYYRVLRLLE